MTETEKSDTSPGLCPVYDIECPSGSEAVASCENRYAGDYNPVANFRDSDIEHCAIYRREQAELSRGERTIRSSEKENSSKGEE